MREGWQVCNEQKVTNNEQKVTSNEQKVTSSEQKVKSNEQLATSEKFHLISYGCCTGFNIYYFILDFFFRAKTTFKVWIFFFAQNLTGIVEKQYVLTPFKWLFKFSHCLTLLPIFSVHVNSIVFHVTAHLFEFYYQQILRKICHVVTKAENKVIILFEFGK